jgi:hypothetical protein
MSWVLQQGVFLYIGLHVEKVAGSFPAFSLGLHLKSNSVGQPVVPICPHGAET